jgi:hypothetical protein
MQKTSRGSGYRVAAGRELLMGCGWLGKSETPRIMRKIKVLRSSLWFFALQAMNLTSMPIDQSASI